MLRVFLKSNGYSEAMIDRMIEGDLKESTLPALNVSPRSLMQTLGTEWGRDIVKDSLWVDILRRRAWQYMRAGLHVVVDDMRFENEYQAIRSIGGQVWKITRPEAALPTGHSSDGNLNHFEFDRVIVNDGSVDDLRQAVMTALEYRTAPTIH